MVEQINSKTDEFLKKEKDKGPQVCWSNTN